MISTADADYADPLSDYYGLPIASTGVSAWSIVNDSHPVIDGPYGVVGSINDPIQAAGSIGNFSRLDLMPGDIELVNDSISGEPTVVVRQVGDGWILFVADEGVFRQDITGSGVLLTPNDLFVANVFAWAADAVAPQEYQLDIDVLAVNDAPVFSALPVHQVSSGALSSGQFSFTTIADVDADGHGDLIAIDSGSGEVVVYQGDGSIEFSGKTVVAGGFVDPNEIATADLDNDGDIDLVVADYSNAQDNLIILENSGTGTFTSSVLESSTDGVVRVDTADLDNDGDVDIVANFWFSGELVWYENLGSGTFNRSVIDTQSGGTAVQAVDVNDDGFIDLVAGYRNSNAVVYYENDGAAGFVSQLYTVSNAYDVAVADLDGDGDGDRREGALANIGRDTECELFQLRDSSWQSHRYDF